MVEMSINRLVNKPECYCNGYAGVVNWIVNPHCTFDSRAQLMCLQCNKTTELIIVIAMLMVEGLINDNKKYQSQSTEIIGDHPGI
jgi:hypothetical protein